MQVEESIQNIERLFQQITGQNVPENNMQLQPFSAEVDPVQMLHFRMDQLLSAIQDPMLQQRLQGWAPPVSLWESDEKIVVHVAIAGVKKEDIDISIQGNTLIVSGLRRAQSMEDGLRSVYMEYLGGPFQRNILLPNEKISSEVNSDLQDGVLKITLPKQTTTKSVKKSSAKSQ